MDKITASKINLASDDLLDYILERTEYADKGVAINIEAVADQDPLSSRSAPSAGPTGSHRGLTGGACWKQSRLGDSE